MQFFGMSRGAMSNRKIPVRLVLSRVFLGLALVSMTSCANKKCANKSFSTYEGFEKFYRENPRSDSLPSAQERSLLEKYRPRLFLGSDQQEPIGFYEDYIANGTLYGSDGTVSDQVDRGLLNKYKYDQHARFVYQPPGKTGGAVVIAKADRVTIPGEGKFLTLKYSFVFQHSGLPAALGIVPNALLNVVADTTDWHQLDHYTAATLLLDNDARRTPLAVLLQQHNYSRVYWFGTDLPLPADRRVAISPALRSNELYPYAPGRKQHKATAFMSPGAVAYFLADKDKPLFSVDDITQGDRQIDYRLEFLPESDAFYSFAGFLGEERALPGRDGPPGADYNTLPIFKPGAREWLVSNWREGEKELVPQMQAFLSKAYEGELTPSDWGWQESRFRDEFERARNAVE